MKLAILFCIVVLFIALMIILQIQTLVKDRLHSTFKLEDDRNLSGFRFFGKENEIIFPNEKKEETEYNDVVMTESNQSNEFDFESITIDHWQEVSQSKYKFYVFSAYYDDRDAQNTYIRIIAATKAQKSEKVVCKLFHAHTYPPTIVDGINKMIRGNHGRKYCAFFILCPISKNFAVPDTVSIFIKDSNDVTYETISPSNMLQIHNNHRLENNLNNTKIAVCVKPMHHEYDKLFDFLQFIELNLILGVSHFILYNHTVGPNVDCILRKYIDIGLITIIPWNLNLKSREEIWTEGIFAALNDCLYRTMHRFNYVLMVDIDELIIPHKHQNLSTMLTAFNQNNGDRAGAYSFQNAFFYLQWPDDESLLESIPHNIPLVTLLKTRRKTELNPHRKRSKYIVMPEKVVEAGNHFVWEFMRSKVMVNIEPSVAMSHHYRMCETENVSDCINANSIIDRRAYHWKEELIIAAKTRLNDWLNCNIDNEISEV